MPSPIKCHLQLNAITNLMPSAIKKPSPIKHHLQQDFFFNKMSSPRWCPNFHWHYKSVVSPI